MRQSLPIHDGSQKYPQMVGKNLSAESSSVDYFGEALVNCYVVGDRIYTRPFLESFIDLAPAGGDDLINGLYYWKENNIMLAIVKGTAYKITMGGVKTLLTATGGGAGVSIVPSSGTSEDNIFRWSEWSSTNCFAAGGNKIFKFTATTYDALTDADAPVNVTHPVAINKFLVANQVSTGLFHTSDVGDAEAWSGVYYEAEGKPDIINAQYAKNLRLYEFGRSSLEVYYYNGTAFERLTQGIVESGTLVPQSVVWCDAINTFVWINEGKQLVKLEGTTPVPISESLDRRLNFLSTANLYFLEGKAHYILWNGRPLYILRFELMDTIVVDLYSGNWYQWLYKSSLDYDAAHSAFLGKTFVETPQGIYVGAGTATSKIYTLKSTENVSTVPRDDSAGYVFPIIKTGYVDRGDAGVDKICNSLTFKFTRLAIDSGIHNDITHTIYLRYRNNGSNTWSSTQTITVVGSGENPQELQHTVYNLGMYKTRQWEIRVISPSYAFSIPIEDFDYVY